MFLFLSLQFACIHPATVNSPVPVQERSLDELRVEVLPAVALLYGVDSKGSFRYGSGILLEEENLILTNWHVVDSQEEISVLFYDPERETYTALDGGVQRVIRESGKSAYRGSVLRTDLINDLALIEVEASNLPWSSLKARETPALPGEAVWALGHPASNVWSFTRGVVSAVHRGAIQHDASVNVGNSGGPLLDMQGRLLGVNTLKLLQSDIGQLVDGISYARPVELAAPLYDEDAKIVMDLSSPEASLRSFWLAVELGRAEAIEAIDFDSSLDWWRETQSGMIRYWVDTHIENDLSDLADELGIELDVHAVAKEIYNAHLGSMEDPAFRSMMLNLFRSSSRGLIQGEVDAEELRQEMLETRSEEDEEAKIEQALMDGWAEGPGQRLQEESEAILDDTPHAWELTCGLTYDREDPKALSRLLKLGLGIEAVRIIEGGETAWVSTSGFRVDGTAFRCSVYFRQKDGNWLQEPVPRLLELESLPGDFAPPTKIFETDVAQNIEAFREVYAKAYRDYLFLAFKMGFEDAQQSED